MKYKKMASNHQSFFFCFLVSWCLAIQLVTVNGFNFLGGNPNLRIYQSASLKRAGPLWLSRDDETTNNNGERYNTVMSSQRRRNLFQITGKVTASAMVASIGSLIPYNLPANAADTTTSPSASDIFLRLRSIPTFCLVDSEGVPFMIFDGQASATGYFFLSYETAVRALEDAREKDKNDGAKEIWSGAKIMVVPLAVAMQLSLRKTQRDAINEGIDLKFNTYNDIVAGPEGISDAQTVDNKSQNKNKWTQKGRVPLFYIEELTLGDGKQPRYFNKYDLILEWKRQHPEGLTPKVEIIEMVDLYRNALARNELDKLSKLAIIPVAETNAIAKKLIVEGGPMPKYDFAKVFLVGSAKG